MAPAPAYEAAMITAIIETRNDEVPLAHALAAPLTRLDLQLPEPGTAPLTHREENADVRPGLPE